MRIQTAKRLETVKEYYFSQKQREIAELTAAGCDVINLGIGSPDAAPPGRAVEALVASARQSGNHGYQPYNGTELLRKGLCDWYAKTYSVRLDPASEVLPLLGSKEGIFYISMAFLDPGDKALIPNPGYPSYAATTRLVGAEPLFYDLQSDAGWLPDLQTLARQDLNRVKIMWCNYPNMPTGALADRDFFAELVDFAKVHHILICHDNPYSLILNPDKPRSILESPEALACCVELNSLSKSHSMAGWRVGMAAGSKDHLQAILRVKSNMDSGMFFPVQAAAAAALLQPASWHDDQNEMYRRRRELVYQLFDRLGCTYQKNCAGLFVWAKVPSHVRDVSEFADMILREVHVCLTPGFIFGSNGKRYLRASLCAPAERIAEAADRIGSLNTDGPDE